jgi:hypothetical protein
VGVHKTRTDDVAGTCLDRAHDHPFPTSSSNFEAVQSHSSGEERAQWFLASLPPPIAKVLFRPGASRIRALRHSRREYICLKVREKPSSYHYLRTRTASTRLLIHGHFSKFFRTRDVNRDTASEPIRKRQTSMSTKKDSLHIEMNTKEKE